MTTILGGGISGLSAAYYAAKNQKTASIVLLEASNRVGGWIRSKRSPNGAIFEQGPRTIRSEGLGGKNTLDLVEDLQLSNKLVPFRMNHPTAKNRLIYADGALHLLPVSIKVLFKTLSLLDRPLITALWTELKAPKVSKEDESLYSFFERRFGRDIADNLVSPMVCGICAGDSRKISVRFLFNDFFEAEQKYGSVVKGFVTKRLKTIFSKSATKNDSVHKDVITSNDNKSDTVTLSGLAEKEFWALWALEGGLEQLPQALANNLKKQGVKVEVEKKCERLTFKSDYVELLVNGDIQKCSRVISSLSAQDLAELLKEQHPQLSEELKAIPTVTVGIVNLEYQGNVLPLEAFGFLVAPKENLPILGVIFDSCVFPQKSSSVLTVMMGGEWFEKHFGQNPTEEQLLKTALHQLKNILCINEEPVAHNIAILKNCIPQHVVGHTGRVKRIHDYISAHKIPLGLCGSSYRGVGLNDVILSAKQAVCDVK